MNIDDLTKNVKNKLDQKLNIKNSLSIINVPKQHLLDKGDLVVLLNDTNKSMVVEYLKDGHYHLNISGVTFPKLLVENIIELTETKLFETTDFDENFDNDYFVDYSKLSTNIKRDIRTFVRGSEEKIREEHLRFGKFCKKSLKKTITSQNGSFTAWMKEHDYNVPDNDCLKEAYGVADKSNDFQLKKRAAVAKCFHKISMVRKNGK